MSSRRWCAISCNRNCRDENGIAGRSVAQASRRPGRSRGKHEFDLGQSAARVLLLAANAFYVAAEFALVKSRGFRIKAMVEQNRFGARLLQDMMGNIEAYLPAASSASPWPRSGSAGSANPRFGAARPVLSARDVERVLHFISFLTGFLVFSSLHIVIGEQVPKTLAIRQPTPVSQWIAYPLYLSYLVFYPLNWLLNTASRGILSLFGVQESQHDILTDSEIEGLVEESASHGGIESGEAEYIQNVFRFGDLAVSDVMVHRTAMVMINADMPPDELAGEVLATEYTRIPLWRDKPENIIGILHAKDLLRAIRASEGDTSASTSPPSCGRRGSCRRCGRSPNS